MIQSDKWKTWLAFIDQKTCLICRGNRGKIYDINDYTTQPRPPVHPRCRCTIQRMSVLLAGTATKKGQQGADWYLRHRGKLPDYYISRNEAEKEGWIPSKGNLNLTVPGKMIGGGQYYNDDGRLPSKNGRIWYEADINYIKGYRNTERIVYSNDGLIFVTYDHYGSFKEIQ